VYEDFFTARPGDPIRAEDINKIARMAAARGDGVEMHVDEWGTHHIPQPNEVFIMRRFVLEEDLYECLTASAQRMERSGFDYTERTDMDPETVADTLGAVAQSPLAEVDVGTGQYYIPAGKCLNARLARDPNEGEFWEAWDFSECQCEGSESSESQPSESSVSEPSVSEPSVSEPSVSEPSVSIPSVSIPSVSIPSVSIPSGSEGSLSESGLSVSESSVSDESESEVSGSESSVSDESESEVSGSESSVSECSVESGSGVSDSGESGSEKSTAVVRASWSPTGFTALFVEESPELRFNEWMTVHTTQSDMLFLLDPKYLEVCESGSLKVIAGSDEPVMLGAKVVGNEVRVKVRGKESPDQELEVTMYLTGIRKGFKGVRFPDQTEADFRANNAFYRQARP